MDGDTYFGLFGILVASALFSVGRMQSSYQVNQIETPTRQVETLREGEVVKFNNKQYIVGQNDSHNPVLNPVLERPYAEGDLELKVEKE